MSDCSLKVMRTPDLQSYKSLGGTTNRHLHASVPHQGSETRTPRPRRFLLIRASDVSGVSGIGCVAEGMEFTDGPVSLRWRGQHPSTATWDGISGVVAVHGHSGLTTVEWIDPPSLTETVP